MLGRNQSRKHSKATGADRKVVPALAIGCATHLRDLDAAPVYSEIDRQPLQSEYAVTDAVQLEIHPAARDRRSIVQQEHSRIAPGHELLQAQDLPPIPQRVLREQP